MQVRADLLEEIRKGVGITGLPTINRTFFRHISPDPPLIKLVSDDQPLKQDPVLERIPLHHTLYQTVLIVAVEPDVHPGRHHVLGRPQVHPRHVDTLAIAMAKGIRLLRAQHFPLDKPWGVPAPNLGLIKDIEVPNAQVIPLVHRLTRVPSFTPR